MRNHDFGDRKKYGIMGISETNKTKKTRQVKSKRTKTQAVGGVLEIYKGSGQGDMLHLWQNRSRFGISCWPLHSEKCGWIDFVLQRDECEWLLLSLQHQLRRKPVRVRNEARARKGKRTIRSKTKKR